jgi:zinc/manganese transport system substrate-binding protein
VRACWHLCGVLGVFLTLCLWSCHRDVQPTQGLRIVATTTMIADLARQLGGHRVNVTSILAPGGDPHVYRPVPQDTDRLASADLVLVNGLRLEHWMEDLIETAGVKQRVLVVSQGIKARVSPLDASVPDPHFWFDVMRWRQAARNVRDELIRVDASGASTYRENYRLYDTQLLALHQWVHARIRSIRPERRKLFTSHDAFAYLGEAYGIDVVAIQGISTDAEASSQDVARVIDMIRRFRIPALFIETSVQPALLQQVARETGAKVGGSLCSDSTGLPEQGSGSYVGMIRDDVAQIVEGLQ